MNNEQNTELSALQIAYKKVCQLGYSHADLIRVDATMTFKTLARIRMCKKGKVATDHYYLRSFVLLIEKEYKRRLRAGGDNLTELLLCMKDILLKIL